MTVDHLVEMVWTEVQKQAAATPAEAVRRLLPSLDLSADVRDELAAVGLIRLAHDAQNHARGNGSRPIAFGRPSGKNLAPYLRILATPYLDAAGRERSLLDFGDADLGALTARCFTTGAGWMKRGNAAKKLRKLLAEHEAASVRDLPAEVLAEVADEWQELFG